MTFQEAADVLLRESGCTVRRYRERLGGVAFTDADDWGIEVPHPFGPVSFAIFAHEVAHQLLHRHSGKPRWLEEVEAWDYALDQFDRFDLPGRDQAERRACRSVSYAFRKALRRGASIHDMFRLAPIWAEEARDAEDALAA